MLTEERLRVEARAVWREWGGWVLLVALIASLDMGCGGSGSGASTDAGVLEPAADASSEPDGSPNSDAPPRCLSFEPCQQAELTADGACELRPLADGTACDDLDACTTADVCAAGSCVGEAVEREPGIRSEVHSFGASPEDDAFEGLAAFVGEARAIVAESLGYQQSRLHLVELHPDGVEVLDTLSVDVPLTHRSKSVGVWGDEPTSFVVPMTPTLVALITTDEYGNRAAGIAMVAIDGDRLVQRSWMPLPRDRQTRRLVTGVAATGETLWLCGSVTYHRYLWGYQLDASGQMQEVVEQPTDYCSELAASPGGDRLYMAGAGLTVFDVRNPRQPTEQARVLDNIYFEFLDASATHIALLSVGRAGDLGAVELVDAATLEHVGTVPAPERHGPTGVAIWSDQLLVQWRQYGVGGDYHAATYTVGANGAVAPGDQWTFRQGCCVGDFVSTVRPIRNEQYAVLQPWRTVLHLGNAGEISPITGHRHGSMAWVLAQASNVLVALGIYASHAIDIADPDAPVILSGGQTMSRALPRYRLAIMPGRAPRLLLSRRLLGGTRHSRGPVRIGQLDVSSAPPGVEGELVLPGPEEHWLDLKAAGRYLFTAERVEEVGVQLYRYDMLASPGPEPTRSDFEALIDLEFSEEDQSYQSLGVDPSAKTLVVAHSHKDRTWTVSWFDLDNKQLTLQARTRLTTDQWPSEIVVHGNRALLASHESLTVIERVGEQVVITAEHPLPDDELRRHHGLRILGFAGQRLHLAVLEWDRTVEPSRARWIVEARRTDDLSLITGYELPDEPLSMTSAGDQLIFGMNNAVTVADPSCTLAP